VFARLLIVLLAFAALAGCGEDDRGAGAGDRVKVVATTTQAADLVRHVGWDDVEVVGLLAPNSDPHDYEVRPRDLQALVDADLVVRSGGDLDDWLEEAIEGSGSEAPVLTLIDGVRTIDDDPHWWQNPRNAILAVGEIERALSEADPARAGTYAVNADRYVTQLRRLDRTVAACIAKVPAAQRKLVTTHDSLGYYAQRYGIEVIGAVIPSLSTSGQPSAGETAQLIRTIREEDVRAIFAESSVNAKVEEAIARETGARVGKALWADTLGPPGSEGGDYEASIAANTRALVDGFTGGEQACDIHG
jgi:zinc/manganese transport system substrate-binding protein